MRISDWSSDVCSSDLSRRIGSRSHFGPGTVRLSRWGILAREGGGCGYQSAVDRRGDTCGCARFAGVGDDLDVAERTDAANRYPVVRRSEERRVGKELVSTC